MNYFRCVQVVQTGYYLKIFFDLFFKGRMFESGVLLSNKRKG